MLRELKVINLRNLAVPKLKLATGCNVFVGENAQGKTNALEAIYTLAYGKPLRGSRDEIINWQQEEAAVFGETERDKIKIVFRRERETQAFINDKPKPLSALLGRLLVVIFYPQEIELLTGPPALRRNFLDRLIATSDKNYLFNLINYQKALGHKNRLLKEKAPSESLEAWDKQLAVFGSKIWLVRRQTADTLNEILRLEAHRLIGKPIFFEYKNPLDGCKNRELIKKFTLGLAAQKKLESRYLATVYGPHRDDFRAIIEETREKSIIEKDLGTFASRGEQRQGVILLKLICGKFLKGVFHKEALFLLDDVASELDINNRQLLFDNLPASQTIVTAASLESLPESFRKKATIFRVKEGKIEPS